MTRPFKQFVIALLLFIPILSPAQTGDREMERLGLLNISLLDTTLHVHLMYAYPDNLMGEAVYKDINQAWLRPEAAEMLLKAQQLLKDENPDWSLIVYDAARPMSVQARMWALVRGTDKTNYVSNPANGGGLHNYGMAVDVSIIDRNGDPLPMGTPVDHLGIEAHTNQEETLLAQGSISQEAFDNRRLLRRIMRKAGFRTILYEWWHFNACSRAEARELYPLIP